MKMKVGMKFYSVLWDEDGYYLDQWILRTIKRKPRSKWSIIYPTPNILNEKMCYFVRKYEFTWVKKSKKHFDYGWADNIASFDRRSETLENCERNNLVDMFRTKLQAMDYAIKDCERTIEEMDDDEIEDYRKSVQKVLSNMKRKRTKISNQRGKNKKKVQDSSEKDQEGGN